MLTRLLGFLFFTMCLPSVTHGQEGWVDLRPQWKVFNGEGYASYSEENDATAIHFYLPARHESDTLFVSSSLSFTFYINHKLVLYSTKNVELPVASIVTKYPSPWLISIHQPDGIDRLTTIIKSTGLSQAIDMAQTRDQNSFLDFSIITTIALLMYFITLVYTNAHLTFDYLNILKLFTIQEREDNLLNSRISATANILFYVLNSLLGGFVFLIIFRNAHYELRAGDMFQSHGFLSHLFSWLKLSSILLIGLFLKLILLTIMTSLFDWRDHLAIHYYNFVRFTFFIFLLTGFLCLLFFVFKVQDPDYYAFLPALIVFSLLLWLVIIVFKLMSRLGQGIFHLFSYLCASEFIPVLITIKVLLL